MLNRTDAARPIINGQWLSQSQVKLEPAGTRSHIGQPVIKPDPHNIHISWQGKKKTRGEVRRWSMRPPTYEYSSFVRQGDRGALFSNNHSSHTNEATLNALRNSNVTRR